MSDMTRPNPGPINAEAQRLLDLLADRATGGLSAPDQAEMEALLRRVPPLTDAAGRPITPESVDAAAASLMIALSSKPAPLPAEARARLLARGMDVVRETASRAAPRTPPVAAPPRGPGVIAYLGWLAAAAAIAFTFIVNYRAQTPALTPSAQRTALMTQPGTVVLAWQPQKPFDAQNVSGDVVWNNDKQEGFVRFKNLAALDPSKEQFQLWIFDKARETYPVDAGVFDLDNATLDPVTGEYIVKMDPKLRITSPAAVAVTIEKAGGVVVTDKSRLVTVAPVPE